MTFSVFEGLHLGLVLLMLVAVRTKDCGFMAFALALNLMAVAGMWWSGVGFPPDLDQSPFVCATEPMGMGPPLLCSSPVVYWGSTIVAGIGTLIAPFALAGLIWAIYSAVDRRWRKT